MTFGPFARHKRTVSGKTIKTTSQTARGGTNFKEIKEMTTQNICSNCETDQAATRQEWIENWGDAQIWDKEITTSEEFSGLCCECISDARAIREGIRVDDHDKGFVSWMSSGGH